MASSLRLLVLATALVGLNGLPSSLHAQTPNAGSASASSGLSKLERFFRIRTPGAPAIAPDGTLYVRDWPDGIFQLYRVEGDAAKPGAKTTKLTHFPDGLSGYSLSPDGKKILLFHAVGGNENTQVSLLDPTANNGQGRIVPVLNNPRVQFSANGWLDDSSGFLFTGNEESPNDFHIYRFDFDSDPFDGTAGKATKLLARQGSWAADEITTDGSRVLVGQYRSISDSSMFELNTASGELTDLTPKGDAPTVSVNAVGYMPGENAILYTSDKEDGRVRLFLRDLKTGEISRPISELDAFELDGAGMNIEKTLLAVSVNEDGYSVPKLYRLPGFEKVAMPEIEKGVAGISSVRGNRVIFNQSNARTPGLAFRFDVSADGKSASAPQQITFADTQGLDLSGFPLPELVKYKAFDGLEIPAFVFLPPGHTKGTPIPFLVNYHGGPEAQSRPGFSAQIQYLLSEGFGVMMPNVRGSTGYGRAFHMLDDYKKRWDSVRDGVDAAEWLVASGYSKPGMIATWGGSYGGYMSVACLVEDAKRVEAGKRTERLFGAGVNIVGIVNVRTFLEKTAGYRRKLREVEYGPLSDPEFLASVSPMTFIDKIQVPVFIAHGFNDPRVPVEEAMQLAVALKDRNLQPQVFIAPDEGHGFAKLDNRLYFAQRMTAFLKQTIAK